MSDRLFAPAPPTWTPPGGNASGGLSPVLILIAATLVALASGTYFGLGGEAELAFAGFAVAVAGVVALAFPLLGLAGLTFVIASNASDNLISYAGLPSLAKLMLPAAVLLVGFRWLVKGERSMFEPRVAWAYGAYAGIMLLGVPFAASWPAAMDGLGEFAKDAVMALLIVSFFSRPAALQVFLATLCGVAAFVCTLSVYKFLIGDFGNDYYGFARSMYYTNRMAGPLNDPNFFGALLVLLLPAPVCYLLLGRRPIVRLIGAYTTAMILACVLLTQSRGTLLAIIFMAGMSLFLFDRKVALRLGALFAVVAVVAGLAMSNQLAERFGSILNLAGAPEAQDESVQGRIAQWVVAAQQFRDHPIMGVGRDNYNVRFQDYSLDLGLKFRDGQDRSAHSLYFETLAELGVVGFAGLLVILGLAWRGIVGAMARAAAAGLTRLRLRYAAFGIGLLGYFFCMIFLHDAYPRMMWTVVAVAIALPRIAAVEIAGAEETPAAA